MRCRITAFLVAVCAAVTLGRQGVRACTAFCATDKDGGVLVGNNEEAEPPRARTFSLRATVVEAYFFSA